MIMLDELQRQVGESPKAQWRITTVHGADLARHQITHVDANGIASRVGEEYVTIFTPWSNVVSVSIY